MKSKKKGRSEICVLNAKLLVLVGNNLAPAEIEAHIREHAPGIKKILFGFQVSGGKKETDRFVCERLGGSWMDIGQLHGEADPRLKKLVSRLFAGTSYKLNWQADMDAYLVACEHCRNAVSEMEQIDLFYEDLMKDYSPEKLKVWNVLRSQMPSWEELHKKYGN